MKAIRSLFECVALALFFPLAFAIPATAAVAFFTASLRLAIVAEVPLVLIAAVIGASCDHFASKKRKLVNGCIGLILASAFFAWADLFLGALFHQRLLLAGIGVALAGVVGVPAIVWVTWRAKPIPLNSEGELIDYDEDRDPDGLVGVCKPPEYGNY